MKKTINSTAKKESKIPANKKYFNRGNTNNNFHQLKKLKINKRDPDKDNSIHSMNITDLKKFATLKGVLNKDLKGIDRDALINLIEWPDKNIKIQNVDQQQNLSNDEQLRLIDAHVKKINNEFNDILKENYHLKELLGDYQINNKNKQKNKLYHTMLWIAISLLLILVIVILIIKK